MGVNFPTAFWKNQQDKRVDDSAPPTITWDLNLYYGLGLEEDLSDVVTSSTFPFDDYVENGGTDFNPNYNDEILGTTTSSPAPYFGWYLDGNLNYPNDVHRANPWVTEEQGRKIDLLFEADLRTWEDLSPYLYVDPDRLAPEDQEEIYNHFVQSGRALGTFTLNSSSTLTIKCSGLGERAINDVALTSQDNWDQMLLFVDGSLVCRAIAPCNGPLVSAAQATSSWTEGSELVAWDVDQCRFFNSAGAQSPNPNPSRQDLSTALYDDLGNVANYSDLNGGYILDNVVQQDNRRKYTTVGGQFSTTQSLSAGDHTINIIFNTNDGVYNSGAFYGATFSFS